MVERLFNETQYFTAFQAGQRHMPMPQMRPKLRIWPRLYRSEYRYGMNDLMFAYWEGFAGHPKPKPKVWS